MSENKVNEFNKVAAIIGKPGLYTLEGVSPRGFVLKPINGTGIIFISVHSKKVMLLKDLGIFTIEDTAPLKEVLINMKKKEEEGLAVPDEHSAAEELFNYLKEVVPNYDQNRVKLSDVKKLIRWYKILKENNLLPEEEKQEEKGEANTDSPQDTKTEKKKATQKKSPTKKSPKK